MIDYILHLDDKLGHLVAHYGHLSYCIIFLVVFAEIGIIFMPFLPGDSLLFAAGMIASHGDLSIGLLTVSLIIAAVLGGMLSYWTGNFIGHLLFKDDDAVFFKKRYLNKTHNFFAKYGGKTLVIGFFMPFVRTYAPFVAGASQMRFWQFLSYIILGAFGWVMLVLYISFFFGNVKWVAANFSIVIILIIIASVSLPTVHWLRHRHKVKKQQLK
ncbi:MAG: VTT domain-containing protein [Pseudomonadota bacterium]